MRRQTVSCQLTPALTRGRRVQGGVRARMSPRAVSQREPCDVLFVPLDALPGLVRDHEIAVLQLERFGQYRVSPILPLEPMRGIGDPHEMRSNFRVEVRGHWNARGAGAH